MDNDNPRFCFRRCCPKGQSPCDSETLIPITSALIASASSSAIASAIPAAAISSASPSATTILTWLRFVDGQAASAVVLVVQCVDGREGIGVRRHLNKAETATPTCLAILNHLSASHLAKRREQVFQVGIRDRESKIADVQLLAHL